MEESQRIRISPRADSLKVESGDGIHDKWALHAFAFEQENDWLPTHLRRYHPDRFLNGELMEGYYDEFIPKAHDSERGDILKKSVDEKTAHCPECEVAAVKYDGDTMCPECGLLCHEQMMSDNLIRDPKAAGRIEDGSL